MRRLGLVLVILFAAAIVRAQTPPAFGNFTCACQPGSPLQIPTPNVLAPGAATYWRGMVYALSAADAQLKARNACTAENRTTPSLCDACQCFR